MLKSRPDPPLDPFALGEALVRRRHVFYVEGYDPQGAAGYYGLFQREWMRFRKVWPIEASLGELGIDSDDFAHWNIEARGPNWRVSTRYEFLRLEGLISSNMAQPIVRQLGRAARWMLDDLVSGALLRVFRASWRFGLHLIFPQLLLLTWVGLAVAGGFFAGRTIAHFTVLPALVALLVSVAAVVAVFAALRPLADRWFVLQLTNGWPYLREFARGERTGYDRLIQLFAERIVDAARTGEADELLLIGHSAGGMTAPAVLARALELDPDLGRRRPRVVLLTVGSLMPAYALHPAAEKLRGVIRRLAVEPSVLWIDGQARKDLMNFCNFDPVGGVGVDVGPERRNPLVWAVRFRDMISPDRYRRLRWNFFRIHYQFIMANDQRGPYDYFMVVCGPVPVADWAKAGSQVLGAFSEDGAYAAEHAGSPPRARSGSSSPSPAVSD